MPAHPLGWPDGCWALEGMATPARRSRVLGRLGLSRRKVRPVHPEADPKARERSRRAAAEAHPGERIALWFMDEARVGQKGRLCHRWWLRGRRPPGRCDQRYEWA